MAKKVGGGLKTVKPKVDLRPIQALDAKSFEAEVLDLEKCLVLR